MSKSKCIRHARLGLVGWGGPLAFIWLATNSVYYPTARFSCTSAHTSCYPTVRLSCTSAHTSCYATVRFSFKSAHMSCYATFRHAAFCPKEPAYSWWIGRKKTTHDLKSTFGRLCLASTTATTSWQILSKWQTKKDEKKDL